MNVECRYFRKEKNIVEIFGSNKERGNYVKIEKKLHLNEKFYSLYS